MPGPAIGKRLAVWRSRQPFQSVACLGVVIQLGGFMGQSRDRAGVSRLPSPGRTGQQWTDAQGSSRPGRGHRGNLGAALARHRTWTGVGGAALIVMGLGAGCAAPSPASSSPAAAAAPTTEPSIAPTYLAPVSVCNHAAKILDAAVSYYANVFARGQAIAGTTQYPNAAARRTALNDPRSVASRFAKWRESSGIEQDISTYTHAFRQADAGFNVSDEPLSIGNWLRDTGNLQADISQWINVELSYQMSAASKTALRAAVTTVNTDINTTRHDVALVRRGK